MAGQKIIFVIFALLVSVCPAIAQEPNPDQEVQTFLENLIQARTQYLINQEPDTIAPYYSSKDKSSRFALQMEIRRAKYINVWADLRRIDLTNAKSRILRLKIRRSGEQAKIFFVNSLQMEYMYPNQSSSPQAFGIGTRHSLTVKKMDGQWVVLKEWYSDPMEENPNNVPVNYPMPVYDSLHPPTPIPLTANARKRRYNRERAVAYADKYAGAAWGAGNNNRYNPKYHDYHYEGGDCTNFASQVLGDPEEGGGLKMTPQWRGGLQGGTSAWAGTDRFKQFITYSGYGRVIAQGTYRQVVFPTSRYPEGAISKLQPGDLIGYILKGNDVDHFCIVVGRDSNGYVLVNSHSGDRFHVPWDIGWDKYTKFVLIHIND